MPQQDKRTRHAQLSKELPYFSYESHNINITNKGLEVIYHFNLAGRYHFYPSFNLPKRDFYEWGKDDEIMADVRLQNLVFHIGMVELISYWKAACPPHVIIKPFSLTPGQIDWWKEVYFQGLGEFYYLNSIVPDKHSFMQIECLDARPTAIFDIQLDNKLIIPVGGGKDSVVSLELLSPHFDTLALILNPRGASLLTAETAGFASGRIIEINRTIDPLLLELNKQDFLNGHTPFSALLAFHCLLAAAITGRRHIALSNESSANEATIEDTEINHQYSKSIAFESDFRRYVASYISPAFNYFSFLRPVNELQIGRIFAGYPAYFDVFKSCNVGSKTDIWCGHCPKCLFAFIILSPFISRDRMVEIFGKDMFADEAMWGDLRQLSGIDAIKPFECVGTVDEVNFALLVILKGWEQQEMPVLLQRYVKSISSAQFQMGSTNNLLNEFNHEHFLQDEFLTILKTALK